MKAKEVVLLILLVFAGVVFYHVQTGKWRELAPWSDDFFFWGKVHVYEETEEIAVSEPLRLEIENRHGDVEVAGQEGRVSLEVTLKKEIRRAAEEEALDVSRRLAIQVSRGDKGRIRIETNRSDIRKQNFRTHFRILAPAGAIVEIRNAYGDVKAAGLGSTTVVNRHGRVRASSVSGDVEIVNSHGAIEIEDIAGGGHVSGRHGDVRIRDIRGDAVVSNSYGKIRLEDVGGNAAVSGRHNAVTGNRLGSAVRVSNTHEKIALDDTGTVDIEGDHSDVTIRNARGKVGITTSHGRVSIEDIRGGAAVKGRNVRVRGRNLHGGPIRIETSHEKLDLDDFTGEADIAVSHGDIRLSPLSPEDGLRVSGRYGAVRILWPRNAVAPLEARAFKGRVFWGLPGPAPHRESNGVSLIRAFMTEKGKPRVVLSSHYSDIHIEESPGAKD